MKRPHLIITLLTLMTLALVAAFPAPAAAESADWCADDPVVSINGHLVTILNGVYGEPSDVRQTVAAAFVEVRVPKGVTARAVGQTRSFFSESVVFVYDQSGYVPGAPIAVQVRVTYHAQREMPAFTDITYPGGRAQGYSTTRGTLVQEFEIR